MDLDADGLDLPDELDDRMDPALAAAVLEIESHVAGLGWDGPAHLFALVETGRLLEQEPQLAASMSRPGDRVGSLTPVEQERLPADQPLEELLQQIAWPDDVAGCAAVVERLVLPPEADGDIPDDPAEAAQFAAQHPLRQTVRIVAGATRAGATYCALRMRAHDDDQSVVGGTDLVPVLLDLVRGTLEEETNP